ncbi:MAG: carbamoyltransferase C-terminal domain-containing protein [Kiloniellales bacterium]
MDRYFLGIHEKHADPSVSLVRDGRLLAHVEEERFVRNKHATNAYPIEALKYCLNSFDLAISDIEAVAINFDLPAYKNGEMQRFFDAWNAAWETDANTKAWQRSLLHQYNPDSLKAHHEYHWRRAFGEQRFPPLVGFAHHRVHAFQAATQSGLPETLVLTLDGSGDKHCTVVWHYREPDLTPIYEVAIPFSVGWFYAAFTEYLGFEAYDGEYKVMGLASYGSQDADLRQKLAKVLFPAEDGIGYCLDPSYIHYGAHSFSKRYTDRLVALMGRAPRCPDEPLEPWHKALAFEVQSALEAAISRLALWALDKSGCNHICLSGGVAHNVALNGKLLSLPGVAGVFPHPLCHDGGAAAGAALLACQSATGAKPERLTSLALGPEYSDDEIRQALTNTKWRFTKPETLAETIAADLASGKLVGWFQGRVEAGPRALGQRSILADPRDVASRDRVNAAVKYRENWRPFCPSVKADKRQAFFESDCPASFMTLALPVTDDAKEKMPAVVHVDDTARVQLVEQDHQPLYYSLLDAFEALTGVPALLNTSFNIKGEPIVCSPLDAIRTFACTGLDVLAIGPYRVEKTAS